MKTKSVYVLILVVVLSLAFLVKSSTEPIGFSVTKVYPKIITPNGDSINETFFIKVDNPYINEFNAKIFQLSGEEITSLTPKENSGDQYIEWNGRDESNNIVPVGTYIYQITVPSEHKVLNGVLVVAY